MFKTSVWLDAARVFLRIRAGCLCRLLAALLIFDLRFRAFSLTKKEEFSSLPRTAEENPQILHILQKSV